MNTGRIDKLNLFLVFFLGILPLGLFVVKGWASGILFVTFFISMCLIFAQLKITKSLPEKFWSQLIIVTLVLPLVAVMVSSGLRGEWIWSDFDAQSRFFLAAPVFYIVYKNRLSPLRYWQYSIPMGLIITMASVFFLPGYYGEINLFDGSRLAIYFVDPLTLGYLSLTLGILSFFSINLFSRDRWYVLALKLIGTLLGFYISLKTQSRTGWIAIPLILFLLLWLHGPKNKLLSSLMALVVSVLLTFATYQLSSTVQDRIHNAVLDWQDYKLDQVNSESSIGERISFARMALYYFKLNPISGWGHKGFQAHINDPELVKFASFNTRNSPGSGALFHSEIATNTVAFGILGLLYTLMLFCVPMALFIRSWVQGINPKLCAFGIAYVLCELVSSLSTEIFHLKFAASFHAIFLACICAQVLESKKLKNEVA